VYFVGIPALMIVACTRTRRSEGQLARMLLLQVGAHLIYTLPFGVTHLMRLFEPPGNVSIVSAINQASIP
jgi:hypothetical protein